MLTLSRKINERILIGNGANQIAVEVLEIGAHHVRLGFVADESIRIYREEVMERRREEEDDCQGGD